MWLEIRCAVTIWARMVGDLPGQQGIPGQRVAASSDYGSHRDAVTTTAEQTRRSSSDDAVGYRAPIAQALAIHAGPCLIGAPE